MPCDSARIMAARSAGVVCGHGPSSNALRAASTARSMSPSEPSGTTPTTSSVAGLITSMVLPLAGATQSPPMNRTSRFSTRSSSAFLKPVPVYGGVLRSYRAPVGEAAGVVAAERAVLEHPPALGAVAGGTGDVVDDAERRAGDDVGVVEVVDLALGEVLASPLPVRPVGVAAVAGAHMEGHKA